MAWERVGRGKLLLRCRLLGGARRFGAHGEERGEGISCRQLVYIALKCVGQTDRQTDRHSLSHIVGAAAAAGNGEALL